MKGDCGEDTSKDAIICVLKETSHYGFTFGNAQKLVNMAAKYFHLACYNDKGLRKNFRYCHCPVDNQMIHVVHDKWSKKDMLSIKRYMRWSKLGLDNKNDENEGLIRKTLLYNNL